MNVIITLTDGYANIGNGNSTTSTKKKTDDINKKHIDNGHSVSVFEDLRSNIAIFKIYKSNR